MFQRFTSALFGDEEEQLSPHSRNGDGKEEEGDEDWILVNYLAEASAGPEEEEEEVEEDLVMIPSPMASPPIRYASCTSLNSTADGGAEEEEDEEEEDEEEEGGFLRLHAGCLEESWFVTPPPRFTVLQPVLLEASPLENLLIEHPSMSVYAPRSSPPKRARDALPRSLDLDLALDLDLDLDLDRGRLPGTAPSGLTPSTRKEKGRRSLEGPRHRPEVAVVPRRSSLHSACYAALSSRSSSSSSSLLQQRDGVAGQRSQPLSRNAMRRRNLLLRPPRGSPAHLHQPSHRHLNY